MNRWKVIGFTAGVLCLFAASSSQITWGSEKTADGPGGTVTDTPLVTTTELSTDHFMYLPVIFNHLVSSSWNVEYMGKIGGEKYEVALQGEYAYLGEGPALTILDISDPTSPAVMGKTHLFPAVVLDVAVAGGYAYLADGEAGLRVVDVSDPVDPIEVGFFDMWGDARVITVSGNYAYLGGEVGLGVVDVSDPAAPFAIGGYIEDPSGKGDYLGVSGVAVVGDYAYVIMGGLRVFDVSDPANPALVSSLATENYIEVVVAEGYAYLTTGKDYYGNGYDGLRVVDVSDPANPIAVGFYETLSYAGGVAVDAGYAYVGDSGVGLRIVDVSDPSNPTLVSTYETLGWDFGVAVAGDYAYVVKKYNGLQVVDISDLTNPSEVSFYQTPGSGYDVAVEGGYAYLAASWDGLWVLDVSNPVNPTTVGFNETLVAEEVAVAGSYAYVMAYDGLKVVDVSDPANPTVVGFHHRSLGYAVDLEVAGGYAYLSDNNPNKSRQTRGAEVEGSYPRQTNWVGALVIVDVTDPANPTEVGFYETLGYAGDVAVENGNAYVWDSGVGLRILDVSDPANPTLVGTHETLEYARVAVAEGYAYLKDDDGLRVLDVSDPTNPTEVGFYEMPGSKVDLTVAGSHAYVLTYNYAYSYYRLQVVDLSNPASLTEVGFYNMPWFAYSVAVAEEYIYVADLSAGLIILRFTPLGYARIGSPADGLGGVWLTDGHSARLLQYCPRCTHTKHHRIATS